VQLFLEQATALAQLDDIAIEAVEALPAARRAAARPG
jgi:hypothetical protein